MVVISISATEASEQIIAGFPKSVALETNIPATIFYTTDGTDPTTLSSIYIDSIILPTDVLEFVIKAFASNGTDTSSILILSYTTNILNDTRLPHSSVSGINETSGQSLYPFGSGSASQSFDYLNNANSGITVNNPSLPVIPYGYDASGNPVGANQPIDDYTNIYSTTNYLNKTYPNVGNLPGNVDVIGRRMPVSYTKEESSRSNPLFDSKAMVIFQDSTTEDPTNPVQLNPQYFSLENLEITKDGSALRSGGLEPASITGSFLRSHYNPRTQMITSYYRDSSTNQWIISSTPYIPKDNDPGNLSGMVFPRNNGGVGKVFTWNLFRYRTLT